jgi:adenylate cyclase
MKDDPGREAVRHLQAIIARETGTPLPHAAAMEMEAVVQRACGTDVSQAADFSFVRREVTIVLADLRGFTAMSATQPAGVVISMLNRCLGRMSEIVFRHHGTIDKFMGDSIMVLFGAPLEHADDVKRALACAIEMQIAMHALNDDHLQQGLPELYMGIGINTGTVMAGKFGSAAYSEYTVIGDEVNLASRIEAFSLRGQVLISETTFQRCADSIQVGEPMEVFVKGKAQVVRLRELLGIPGLQLQVPRQEIRRSHRVEVKLPCVLHEIQNKIVLPYAIKAKIRDIGYHGVLVELDHELAVHTDVKLEFDLHLVDYRASDIYAKVVKTGHDEDGFFAGLEFTSVNPDTNMHIQLFVQLLVAAQ